MKGLIVRPNTSEINIDCPATSRASSFCLAPKFLATSAVVPTLRAVKIIAIMKLNAPANPTAATGAVPNLPIIIMSTMKTAICKTFSRAAGRANLIMFLFRFSFVSSISSFSNRNCG